MPSCHSRLGAMSARRRAIAAAAALVLIVTPAKAALVASAVDGAGVALPPNARLPTALVLVDESGRSQTLAGAMAGRPSLLLLTDYTCRTLCGPVLAMTAAALDRSGLVSGTDYRLLVIGLDPKDRASDAQAMKQAQLGDDGPLLDATSFLLADTTALARITASLGYRAVYDSENDQF